MDSKVFYFALLAFSLPLLFPANINAESCIPTCMNNGICLPGNSCQCNNNGWTGSRCQVPMCTDYEYGCGPGICVAPNVCNCNNTGYSGDDCTTPLCIGSYTCQNGGTCIGPNTCECTGTGYTGSYCSIPVCNGQKGCGPGTCIGPDQCSCENGWTGTFCTTRIFFL